MSQFEHVLGTREQNAALFDKNHQRTERPNSGRSAQIISLRVLQVPLALLGAYYADKFTIKHLRRIAAKRQTSRCPQLSCTAEHLIPRSNSGKDTRSNIVAACKFCNALRHRQFPILTPSGYAQIVRNLVEQKKWYQHHSEWSSLA